MFHKGPRGFLAVILAFYLVCSHGSPDPQPIPLDFCRRFSQQTGVIDNKLFVDGGYVDYGGQIDESSVNQTNNLLLWADWNATNDATLFPPLFANGTKNASVPSVAGGAMWADDVNKVFYVYGGEYNVTTQVPQTYTLWFYDAIYNTWNASSNDAGETLTPAYGGSAVDPYAGTGYYYGGWISNQTIWSVEDKYASSDLVSFNFRDQTFNSPRSFFDEIPRAEGALFWIPAGDSGMLVYFGGVQQSTNGTGYSIGGKKYVGVSMSTIYILDIANQRAYTQSTTGLAPASRRLFCGGVSWPDDRSSYNIYIYGGLPPYEMKGLGYDEVWILSIPSFTWTLFYQAPGGGFPHHSSSCNVLNGGPGGNGGQMIVMGGWFPNSSFSGCDVPTIGGMHNLYMGTPEQSGDSATYPWGKWLTNLTKYTVPSNLTEVIGGSADGGATRTGPVNGWNTADLGNIILIKDSTGSRNATRLVPATGTPTTSSSSTGDGTNHAGVIAGSVVGGLAGIALVLAGVWFLLRKAKRAKQEQEMTMAAEMAATPAPSEMPLSPPQSFAEPGSPKPLKYHQGSFEMPDNQSPAELPGTQFMNKQ